MLLRGLPSLGAFFLKATAVFLLLLPLWLAISPFYTRLLAGIASQALPFVTPSSEPASVAALQTQGNRIILISGSASSRSSLPGFWAVLVHGNTMILLALFLADPRLRLSQRLRPFAWALCALFGWHVGHTLFLVKLTASSGALYSGGQGMAMISAFDRNPANVFFQIFAPQLIPFALWALFLFRPLAWEERERAVGSAQQRVGRNDPCPCGSGKKYKRCCGK